MDFDLDDEQQAIADLAATILADRCPPDALRTHEASGAPYPADTWTELAKADLLGIALPEAVGGGGYGVLEACLVAEQVGRHVAPVPFADTLAAAIVLAGDPAHADRVRAVVAGDAVLTTALDEPGSGDEVAPRTVASSTDGTWALTGTKSPVQWAAEAAALLVAATTGDGSTGLFLVEPGASGLTITAEDAMWGLPTATVELAATPAVRVGGDDAVAELRRTAIVIQCATVAGLCEGALRLTATYVSEREQFGTKIGTFQAVAQRMADAYIDTEAIRLTSRQAAWRLGDGLPADDEIHIAKFWATDGSHRVVHAGQHLHGGVGFDLESPIHRYFRWAKVLELQLGSGIDHLRALGASIAATPA